MSLRTSSNKILVCSSVHNRLKNNSGLNLKFVGASYISLMAGQVMRYSVHPNSVRNSQTEVAKKHRMEID